MEFVLALGRKKISRRLCAEARSAPCNWVDLLQANPGQFTCCEQAFSDAERRLHQLLLLRTQFDSEQSQFLIHM